jgi:hypothetical protein
MKETKNRVKRGIRRKHFRVVAKQSAFQRIAGFFRREKLTANITAKGAKRAISRGRRKAKRKGKLLSEADTQRLFGDLF